MAFSSVRFFKKNYFADSALISHIQNLPSSSSHLLWTRTRPQKKIFLLKLHKVVKRHLGSRIGRPISSSPLCSATLWWSARAEVKICFWKPELACSDSLSWRNDYHWFLPLIKYSELVCLRVIITCLKPVNPRCSYTLLVPEENREEAQISLLNFSLTFHLLPSCTIEI